MPNSGGLIPKEYSMCEYAKEIHCEKRENGYDEWGPYFGHDSSKFQAQCPTDLYYGKFQDEKLWEGFETEYKAGKAKYDAAHRRLASGPVTSAKHDSYEDCLQKECQKYVATKCGYTPDFFTLIGHTWVAMMIFESGMHFNFEMGKVVGPWASLVAIGGTFGPLFTGAGIMCAFGYDFFSTGVAAGVALAPTSVGIALKLLGEANVLGEYFGQAIITAAFVDDILSLILFNILFALGEGNVTFVDTFLPVTIGIVFMIVAVGFAIKPIPQLVAWVLSKVPKKADPDAKVSREEEVLFFLMLALFVAYCQLTHLMGTHLWGAFIAGMSFSSVPHAHHAWSRQTKRITKWMLRLFFSCTVAFAIPIMKLMDARAFGIGALMGVGPCIATKVLCAFFMGPSRWVIGWAMSGRAEFAYLIAQMAVAGALMPQDAFAIVIWSLLWATILAPFFFRFCLNRYVKNHLKGDDAKENSSFKENQDAIG